MLDHTVRSKIAQIVSVVFSSLITLEWNKLLEVQKRKALNLYIFKDFYGNTFIAAMTATKQGFISAFYGKAAS